MRLPSSMASEARMASPPIRGPAMKAPPSYLPHLAETAQHAGHADIIRESIDGAKTMG